MEIESEITQEMDLIKMMLNTAKEEGLEVEVIHSFATALRDSSAPIEECVNYALSDWDIL